MSAHLPSGVCSTGCLVMPLPSGRALKCGQVSSSHCSLGVGVRQGWRRGGWAERQAPWQLPGPGAQQELLSRAPLPGLSLPPSAPNTGIPGRRGTLGEVPLAPGAARPPLRVAWWHVSSSPWLGTHVRCWGEPCLVGAQRRDGHGTGAEMRVREPAPGRGSPEA